jgi:Gram-negative bacterial TonB protein C-terminal
MQVLQWVPVLALAVSAAASAARAPAVEQTTMPSVVSQGGGLISQGGTPFPDAANREALVYVRVTISPQGIPSNPELVADRGFYEERFVKDALSRVKGMRFKPGTRNGKAVQMTVVLPLLYCLGGSGKSCWAVGVTPEFRTEMKRVTDLFGAGDYTGADQHAEMMLRDTVKFGYEFAVLKATLAQTHAANGDDDLALRYAAEATQRIVRSSPGFTLLQSIPPNRASNYLLPEGIIKSLLQLRMRITAKEGLLTESLQAYYELAGLETIAPDDPQAQLAAQMTAKLQSKDPLVAKGRVIDQRGWSHELFRDSFSLDNVHGDIKSLQLACGHDSKYLDYVPGEQWSVPPGWQDCAAVIGAAPDTSFDFVEAAD